MKFYLFLKSIPELKDLPRRERGRIWRENALKGFGHWQTWAALLFWAFLAVSGLWSDCCFEILRNSKILLRIVHLVSFLAGCVIFQTVLTEKVRPYLKQAIKK